MSYLLALDQGGHASRALVFDESGVEVARSVRAVDVTRSGPDRVEQDPNQLVTSLEEVASEVLRDLGASASLVRMAGLATQRSSIVCWDRHTGESLGPVLSWQDRRNAKQVDELAHRHEEIRKRTGLFPSAHHGASKLRWCFDHWPKVRAAAAEGRLSWGPLASFLSSRLTACERRSRVDPANASRTLLWSIDSGQWDPDLLDWFGLGQDELPECVPTVFDHGSLAVAPKTRLGAVTGDQSAALYAFGAPDPSVLFVNLGTGAFLQRPLPAGTKGPPRLPASVVLQDDAGVHQVVEGVINGAGAAMQWFVEKTPGLAVEAELEGWLETETAPAIFLNGVSGIGSPYWVADYESRFFGSERPEARAVGIAESVLFLIRVNLGEMNGVLGPPAKICLTGGFAQIDALCQMLANLTGVVVERPAQSEATARGVAWIASGRSRAWPAEGSDRFEPSDDPDLLGRFERWRRLLEESIGES